MPEKVFLTEGEVAKWIGVTLAEYRAALPELDKKGFPPKDPQFGNKRYAPAIKQFFDRQYRLLPRDPEWEMYGYPPRKKRGRF